MKKQPLKALAIFAVLAGGLAAIAVQATEVSDVLKAGASKVHGGKKQRRQKLIALRTKLTVCSKSSSRSTSKLKACVFTIHSSSVKSQVSNK